MSLQMHITAIISIFFLASIHLVSSDHAHVETVTMCGCPGVETAVQECAAFEVFKCSPHYNQFDESKGLFAYILPVVTDPDEKGRTTVRMLPYTDEDCTSLKFQPSVGNGWVGKCNKECWSETESKWGAKECESTSASFKSTLTISIPVFLLAMILF